MRRMDWCALSRAILARFSTNLDMNWRVKPISKKAPNGIMYFRHNVLVEVFCQIWKISQRSLLYDLGFFLICHTSCQVCHCPRCFLPPLADQELHSAGGSSSAQGCTEAPRPMEELWVTWLLVVSSEQGVCDNRCHKNVVNERLCFSVPGLLWGQWPSHTHSLSCVR